MEDPRVFASIRLYADVVCCLLLVCDDGVVVVCEDILVCGGVVMVNVVEDAYELKYSGRI